ncbi:uncharacterized protein AtWU_06700 [Aspergillus tubingensis]|uniref:Uncharacterized protein n=1 Tax=Aspergillus niger TaxID=5061 RepID=A0A100IJA6_ASPNG|nr:uncharacterized protein AtWU_06700 [Aspergillus tubingensis]GAQ42259.1 hypothetical protein PFICI_08779 [Aspergillus niger]GFN16898.1 hypothetical protein AtWU_06700 [Aspergillus tubingensis]
MKPYSVFHFIAAAMAAITISDPGDIIPAFQWESDNAIIADYNVSTEAVQRIAQVGPYMVRGQEKRFNHTTLAVDGNDTSVLVATEHANVYVDHTEVVKFGYSSNLIQASFYGVNSAVLVANNSQLRLTDVNITTHNGAANVYAYGTDSVAYIDNAWLYSSGPTAHGLYAAGNGTIRARNVHHFSGGNRCSSFSGDTPAGYLYVEDSIAHTTGIGSAIVFAVKHANLTNVVGYAEQSPAFFTIGEGHAVATDCDLTAGLLGGAVIFSISKDTQAYPFQFTLENTRLKVLGDAPGLWYGTVYADSYIRNSQIITEEYLEGDLVAYNGSTLGFSLERHSHWKGRAYVGYGEAELAVYLDKTSSWNLTGDTALKDFTNADMSFGNVNSNGFSVTYDADAPANKALARRTFNLTGGGTVSPA